MTYIVKIGLDWIVRFGKTWNCFGSRFVYMLKIVYLEVGAKPSQRGIGHGFACFPVRFYIEKMQKNNVEELRLKSHRLGLTEWIWASSTSSSTSLANFFSHSF